MHALASRAQQPDSRRWPLRSHGRTGEASFSGDGDMAAGYRCDLDAGPWRLV
ncbi:hypothetical protein HBI24_107750 [Parastagonospora nodorum]|nr:hypothetical protein HBI24_107750 [Parastagonospora nodorum]KAH6019971.1 hypothetical protein HBI83_113740 [Parastagonospora nodorum]KAH6041468.1 hypothetical protein HBI54_149110 [Parastagonospora nodorum]